MISGILVVIAFSILCIGFVHAFEKENYPVVQPTISPIKINVSDDPDSGVEIQNVTEALIYWNERMEWKLSQKQIGDFSIAAENQILKNLTSTDGKWYHIKNLTKFDEDLGALIGLSDDQVSEFITEDRNQLAIDHMNYHKPYQTPEKSGTVFSITPGSQSAPYAQGRLYYLYIFTDFTIPSADGVWTPADRSDVEYDAGLGTLQIQNQAPSAANVVNDGGWVPVSVTGQNFGSNDASTWGPDGWMEHAAQMIEGGNSGPYERPTENLAYNIGQDYNADSVILCFFTHDDKGSTATSPDQGYADKVLVSYWGIRAGGYRFNSESGSYEHEIVHAYGALDEWGGNGVGCNYQPSGLAVSPMYEMYKNTNFYTCPGATQSGVMFNPYNAFLYPWWQISQSSQRWIGWGDYDNDGIIDPLDPRPWGENSKIGIFRPSTHKFTLDFNGNGIWEGAEIDREYDFGTTGDIPITGDWDGNGITEVGAFRPSTHTFYLRNAGYPGVPATTINWGIITDLPVTGDWDGNGMTEVGVFRPSTHTFYLRNAGYPGVPTTTINWGISTDLPVIGDWDGGNGITEVGVFRPSTHTFYLRNAGYPGVPTTTINWGLSTDLPVTGTWA